MKRNLSLLILILPLTLCAQHIQYSMVPQYFLISGLRTDLDIKLGEHTWLSLAPHLYANQENISYYSSYVDYDMDHYDNSEYDKMFGFGGNLGLVHYLPFKTSQGWQFLFSYGLSYMQYQLEYEAAGWHTIDYEGLEALEYGLHNQETRIQQYGGIVYMGLFIPVDERFFIELYLGSRLKYSTYEFSGEQERRFNDNILNPGYTGIVPYTGVRYGLRF